MLTYLTAALAYCRSPAADADDAASEIALSDRPDAALLAERPDRIVAELRAVESAMGVEHPFSPRTVDVHPPSTSAGAGRPPGTSADPFAGGCNG